MRQRLILSLLSIAALVYLALPRLMIQGDSLAVWFAWVWLGFCVIAFGGNLAGLLYRTRRKRQTREKPGKSRHRHYERGTSI